MRSELPIPSAGPPPAADGPPTRPGRRAAPSGPAPYPFLLPPARPDEIGRLGNYRVLRLLGKGGMGLVFHAEDPALCRPVALKVMRPNLDGDKYCWERFLREARLMASIKHESLVTVYQVGQEQGVAYLAMELLQGTTLEGWLSSERPPDLREVLRVGRQIAGGLAAIHRRGLIHRDLKPANLWVEQPGGRVKVLDFGLARFIDDDAALTQPGAVLGTPCFMSPEQARGEPVGPASDLFSFGCVLYNLCTGVGPFESDNTTAALTALAVRDPGPPHRLNPAVPRELSALVMELLAKRPEDRPPSAEAVLARLRQIEEGKPGGPRSTPAARRPSLSGTRPRPGAATPAKTPAKQARPRLGRRARPRRRWALAALAFVLAAATGVGVAWAVASARRPAPAAPAEKAEQSKTYLSDLSPVERDHWPFLPPAREGQPPLRAVGARVQGREWPHAFFMHPPPPHEGSASLTYRLGGASGTFHATVSMHDGPPVSESPATFAVYGDGRLLWRSGPVSSQADAQDCAVSVQGVDRLRIEVRSGGDPRGAHMVWLDPHLTR
jgi:hypothetical protein